MRPSWLKTKIFLDSGDPKETKQAFNMLEFLDGQTTNPTLIAKNPEVQERLGQGERFSKNEIKKRYQDIIKEINKIIFKKNTSISVEIYADQSTSITEMITQAMEMSSWINNIHIKLPITSHGLKAAQELIKRGKRLNMTLCFTQAQAAAVYVATKGAKKGQVFISPFVGRLDDQGQDGMSLVKNIIKMYKQSDGHVQVLTASVRNLNHFLSALNLGSDIITASFKVLKEWKQKGLLHGKDFIYQSNLKEIKYKEFDLNQDWSVFSVYHELTDQGLEKFAHDWQALIK